MSELFKELQESMKEDRLEHLWKRFGEKIIIGCVGLVVLTAVVVGWNHYTRSSAMKQTAIYLQAVSALEKKDLTTAIEKLNAVEASAKSPLNGLVLLKKIEAYTLADKPEEAQKAQKELAGYSHIYSDLANMMVVDAVSNKATDKSPLYFSRSHWQAWQLLDAGKKEEAKTIFSSLADAEDAPVTLRERAKIGLSHLGADAATTKGEKQ